MTPRIIIDRIYNKMKSYLDKYLSTRVIFVMDLVISMFSSAFILLMVNSVSQSLNYRGLFVVAYMSISVIATIAVMLVHRGYRNAIRHFRFRDIAFYTLGSAVKGAAICIAMLFINNFAGWDIRLGAFLLMAIGDFLITLVVMVGLRVAMIIVYNIFIERAKSESNIKRVLVYRTSEKSISMVQRFANSSNFKVVGFISSERIDKDLKVADLHVYSFDDEASFLSVIEQSSAEGIMITSEKNLRLAKETLVNYATSNGIKVYITPGVDEYHEDANFNSVREVKIEDLLGREEIKISLEKIRADFKDKVVMVTGAAGSIGSELVRQLAGFGVGKIILFDNGETPMHNLRLELEDSFEGLDFVPVIGDVRSVRRLEYVFEKFHPQIVFHAAAYKHVPLMEDNPCEAVCVNVTGTRQVADKCVEYGVEKMVMVSTDKAVNPTNIMGCTKRLAEIYVQSLGLAIERGEVKGVTRFITTRFGNVLGSNGSVIPRFREQIAKGGPVTVTDPEITRFFMTIPEACRLVMEAAVMDSTNRIVVFDMGEPVKIDDLARKMIHLSGLVPDKDIQIVYSGLRPGEKLYEEVLSSVENTEPTVHDRIRIAKVREYEYCAAVKYAETLEAYGSKVMIPEMVQLMKEIVPEFKSNNSVFEQYDK